MNVKIDFLHSCINVTTLSWSFRNRVSNSSLSSFGHPEARVTTLCAIWSMFSVKKCWMRGLMATGQVSWRTWASVLNSLASYASNTSYHYHLANRIERKQLYIHMHHNCRLNLWDRLSGPVAPLVFPPMKFPGVGQIKTTCSLYLWLIGVSFSNNICLMLSKR